MIYLDAKTLLVNGDFLLKEHKYMLILLFHSSYEDMRILKGLIYYKAPLSASDKQVFITV